MCPRIVWDEFHLAFTDPSLKPKRWRLDAADCEALPHLEPDRLMPKHFVLLPMT